MAKIVARIKESASEIKRVVLEWAKKIFGRKITTVSNQIIPHIKNAIKQEIERQPEYIALSNPGILSAHFGLPDGHRMIEGIVDHWISNIYIRKTRQSNTNSHIVGGVEVLMPPPQVMLDHPNAQIVTEKGQSLPWLKWLLFDGHSTIIYGYRIFMGISPKSRSGQAYMIEDVSGTWGVPEGFQGTSLDNFMTKAIADVKPKIDAIIQEYLLRG